MEYQKALARLKDALKFGINPGLENIQRICDELGNPQDAYECMQIAGTNGKSSTSRFAAALLKAAGLKTALYTSPELVHYPERMEIDGVVVSDQAFADAIEAASDAALAAGVEATEFELLTAGALWLYAREGVEAAVLECGLGGRWDATSVCSPRVAVITGIGLDHTHILGDTLEAIAAEKAAIIKQGCKAVFPKNISAFEVFAERAKEVGAPVRHVNPQLKGGLAPYLGHLPSYQLDNAALAYEAVDEFLSEGMLKLEHAEKAWTGLQIPGRFETLRSDPLLLIDAAHNPQSAAVLAAEVQKRWPRMEDRPTLLLGVLADKDVRGVVHELVPLFERIVVTASESARSISPDKLVRIVVEECAAAKVSPVVEAASNIRKALDMLSNDSVIATGSITVAGEVKRDWC